MHSPVANTIRDLELPSDPVRAVTTTGMHNKDGDISDDGSEVDIPPTPAMDPAQGST